MIDTLVDIEDAGFLRAFAANLQRQRYQGQLMGLYVHFHSAGEEILLGANERLHDNDNI